MIKVVLFGMLPLFTYFLQQPQIEQAEVKTVTFEKSGEVVLNPGQGWILYGLPGNQSPETIALGTTGYQRYDWCVLNPEENVYNWAPVDNAIAQWAEHGKQFCFGVMSVNTFGNVYTTPKWVFDKGALYTMGRGERSEDMIFYIPVWNDPIYITACKTFAEAMAARYDGNPNVAFIDVRNYGNWGENHMYPFERSTVPIHQEEITNLLFKPYVDNFKKTPVLSCHFNPVRTITWQDGARFDYDYESVKHWAVDHGMGLRTDGIMGRMVWGDRNGAEIAMAIGKTPIAWEFAGTFRYRETARDRPWDDEQFLEIIKEFKPHYIGMGQWGNDAQYMLSKKQELIRQAANLMGFNFSMKNATYPSMISTNEKKEITVTIENSGATTMFNDCVIKLVLLDGNDRLASSYKTEWNIKNIKAGEAAEFKAAAGFPALIPGAYRLAIGLFCDVTDQLPTYNLDNKDKTSNGFYIIGNVTIK